MSQQSGGCVAIGIGAGLTGQGTGYFTSTSDPGYDDANDDQIIAGQGFAVAIGGSAGATNQGVGAVAIGGSAGFFNQGVGAVAIGLGAGADSQGAYSVAIGSDAGLGSTGANAVAIGNSAGADGNGDNAVAIGLSAGSAKQGQNTIAIGNNAGFLNQGQYAIALGYQAGYTGQHNNTIILSGLTGGLNSSSPNSFYVAPVNGGVTGPNMLYYNTSTYEITYGAKSFVIDHPLDAANKYLVHTCLEGPEVGVYYRGKGEIVNGTSVVIYLPDYFGALCNGSGDATVQITHIYDGKVKVFSAGEVDLKNNAFTVYGENGRFNWLVHGKRGNIRVECDKSTTNVKGDGPYKYIV